MKHKRGWLITGAVVAVLGIGYGTTSIILQNNHKFLANTEVAGVNIGGQTAASAAKKVDQALENRTYHVNEKGHLVYAFNSKDAGMAINTKPALTKLEQQQNYWSWPAAFIGQADASDTTSLGKLAVKQTAVQDLVSSVVKKANQQKRTQTADAKLVAKNDQLVIQKQVYGNNLDRTKLTKVIKKALADGKTKINLADAYVTPKITSNSSALKTAQKTADKYLSEKAQYNINGNQFTIPRSEILSWITTDQQGKVTLDQTKVQAYVTELNDKYHTFNTTRTFHSTQEGTVKVKGGLYGWSIKIPQETTGLTKQVLAGKDFVRKPVVQGSGYGNSKTDIGNTYIEVDKKAQHMWVYVDGKVKVSTDVVTGKPGKHATTNGVWDVWSKQRNATLRGQNDNGSNYASKVSYWMPFDDTGEGIHDSPWQPQYGGTWYISHGSHGCVNTPPSIVGKVYDAIKVGTPVVVID